MAINSLFGTHAFLRPVTPLTILAVAGMTWIGVQHFSPSESAPASASDPSVFHLQPLERLPSSTVEDWASVADAVVTGTVTAEAELEPPRSETSTRDELLGRTVDVHVDDVLWRSPTSKTTPPESVTLNAVGWLNRNGEKVEAAISGSPRLEVGHRYVLALVWMHAECAAGDYNPATWTTIGSGGALPADADVLGDGEIEGSTLTGKASDSSPTGLLATHRGEPATALVDDLEAADVERVPFQAASSVC